MAPYYTNEMFGVGLKKKESGPGHTWGGEAASAQEMAASAKRT